MIYSSPDMMWRHVKIIRKRGSNIRDLIINTIRTKVIYQTIETRVSLRILWKFHDQITTSVAL